MSKNTQNKKSNRFGKIFETILTVLIIVVAIFAISITAVRIYVNSTYEKFFVNGQSMYPTLNQDAVDNNGNKLGVNGGNLSSLTADHIDYGLYDPRAKTIDSLKRFDIVICSFGNDTDACIKRVVGLPGETIRFTTDGVLSVKSSNGNFVVTDQPIESQYIVASNYPTEVTLGNDEYYCLGDNRKHSSDSRERNAVKREKLYGKVVCLLGYCSVKRNDSGDYDIEKIHYTWPRFF